MTDIDLLLRDFRADQPGPVAAPAAVAAAAKAARGPRRRQLRRRLLAGAGVTATVAGIAALLFVALPGGGGDRTAEIPGGYAAVATVRVTAPGGVTEAVMARVQGLIARRARAQGVAGVEIRRAGTDTLTLVVPRNAGWERVRLLTADPDIRIVDITDGRDPAAAPVVVPPGRITDVAGGGDRLRVEVSDRTAGGLSQALADGRTLVLIGSRGDGDDDAIVGNVDDAASAALSSEALLVTPRDARASGVTERWAVTLAGGGVDAKLDVVDVHTEGVLPDGAVEVPKKVLEIMDAAGLGEAPLVPGSIRPLIDGVLQGRRVTEWQGIDSARHLRGMLAVEGDSLSSAGCGNGPTPAGPLVTCYWGSGGETAHVGGVADPRIVRIELRRAGAAYPVLRSGVRFVGITPLGNGGRTTVLGFDANGTTIAQIDVEFPDPTTSPTTSP